MAKKNSKMQPGLLSCARESWLIYLRNPKRLITSMSIDLLFFFIFAFVYSYFSMRIMEHLVVLNEMIGKVAPQVAAVSNGLQNSTVLSEIMASEEIIAQHFNSVFILSAATIISVYIIWCGLQGTNWWIAARTQGLRASFLRYMKDFSLVSLFWLAIMGLIVFALIKATMYNQYVAIAIVSEQTLDMLASIVILVVFYLAIVSYAIVGREKLLHALKDTFVLGVKGIPVFIPAITFLVIACFLPIYLISLLGIGLVPAVIVDLLILLPIISYGRLLLVSAAKHKQNE